MNKKDVQRLVPKETEILLKINSRSNIYISESVRKAKVNIIFREGYKKHSQTKFLKYST